jgi:hypothetical protein
MSVCTLPEVVARGDMSVNICIPSLYKAKPSQILARTALHETSLPTIVMIWEVWAVLGE